MKLIEVMNNGKQRLESLSGKQIEIREKEEDVGRISGGHHALITAPH